MAFLDPPDAAQKRRRYWIAAGSVLATTVLMTLFLIESRWGYMKKDPVVIYAQSWTADRTRADTLADAKATKAARDAAMAQSRAYIATLTGKAKEDAQAQFDAYVNGGGAAKQFPYVPAKPAVQAIVQVPAEPPIE
jgi:hypothetical protein